MKERINLRFLCTFIIGILLSLGTFAQQITVKGHVKDEKGEPIMFASIAEEGTTNGTNSDVKGNFVLKVNKGATLIFSNIGYKKVTRKAAPQMLITLEENTTLLKEVVVIGYAKVKKEDATGSVTAIKPDEMNKGVTTNAQDLLIGKVAGVSVSTDGGTPGGGAQILIRGGSSLNASNKPLIVIDGLAMDNEGVQGLANPLAMINPEDIATFTVLKDASATAIYGSRASNGVIIITTKKGRKNTKPTVSYRGNVSVSTTRNRFDVLDGDEYRSLVTKVFGEGNLPIELGTANTDWQDEIFQTAISHDHNVSVSGGIGNLPYRVSIGYTNQEGIIKTSEFERITTAVNLNPTFFDDHLKVNFNAKYMNAKNRYADGGAIGNALSMDPTRPIYSNEAPYKFTGGYWQYVNPTTAYSDPAWNYTPNPNSSQNPLALLNLKDDRANSNSFISNIELDYKLHFLPDVHIHANIGGDYSEGKQDEAISPYSFGNNYYGYNGTTIKYKYNIMSNIYAQYTKKLKQHNFDVMAGAEEQHFHRNGYNEGWGLDPVTKTQKNPVTAQSTAFATRNSLVSYFGRLNYGLLNRYLLTFTMRFDGSSRFSKDNRWGSFPSLAFAWKLKEEKFFLQFNKLSELKLRLGWGITGQQNIGEDFYYKAQYINSDPYAQYAFGDTYYNTSRPKEFNEDLTWEKTTTWNAGLDFGFLNGRFTGNLDFYFRQTKDLLNTVKVAAGTNFNSAVLSNIGKLENKGIEFTFNAKPIVTKDFVWTLGYNITWNDNEITELNSGNNPDYYVETGETVSAGIGNHVQANKVGYAANSFFVYQQVYDKNGKPIENMFVDRNGDGQINASDKYMYKKPTADVLMGLSSKMVYKNWDFSFSLRASLNNYLYCDFLSGKANISEAGLFSNSNYSNKTLEAIALGFQGKGDYYMSDYFVRNASFLRCDNITLGYSFNNLFGKGKFNGIGGRVFAVCQNPFVITQYDGLDPEVNSGVDKDIYPRPITFQLGVNLTF